MTHYLYVNHVLLVCNSFSESKLLLECVWIAFTVTILAQLSKYIVLPANLASFMNSTLY